MCISLLNVHSRWLNVSCSTMLGNFLRHSTSLLSWKDDMYWKWYKKWSTKMIVSAFPDHIRGYFNRNQHKYQLYNRIIYSLINYKYRNRKLRKSLFALLYMSYVFVKMIPMSLAIETNNAKSATITPSTTIIRTKMLPEMPLPVLEDDDDDYSEEDSDYPGYNSTGKFV